ncbi:MAG TPA: hypothetical protein VLB83_04750 [Candidatus Paceibacterota bacterium]|nr:hypothetical protein [Candidatus Paceibacterota bacterium]
MIRADNGVRIVRTILKTLLWSAWIAIVVVGWSMVRHPETVIPFLGIAPEMCIMAGLFVLILGFAIIFLADTWIDLHFPDPEA